MTDSGTDRRRAFEDLAVGERFEIGPFEMKEADTIAFARDFINPRPGAIAQMQSVDPHHLTKRPRHIML